MPLRGFRTRQALLPSKRAMSWIFAGAIMLVLLMVAGWQATCCARPVKNDPKGDMPEVRWSWMPHGRRGNCRLKHHKLEDNCESCHVTPFVSVAGRNLPQLVTKILGDHARKPRLAAGMAPLSSGVMRSSGASARPAGQGRAAWLRVPAMPNTEGPVASEARERSLSAPIATIRSIPG